VRSRNGFTLVELLAVIAVLAILGGLLFPVFVQARAKVWAATCLSNAAQIGHGLAMYSQGIGFGRAGLGGACSQENPHFFFAGNDIRWRPLETLAEIQRPAETVILSDGFTGILKSGAAFSTLMGCEAATAHEGGGTHVFVDGHARWIAGNSERYLERDPSGCWYKKYYAIDR
jgi:prepilin-type N-terminal cleavage/methylation domain-containing protein